MKKFKGLRNLDIIISEAKKQGWDIDTDAFDKGGDYIYLRDMYGQVKSNDGFPRQVALNTFNGHFYVYIPVKDDPVANHMSEEFEGEEWYDAILELVYEPLAL